MPVYQKHAERIIRQIERYQRQQPHSRETHDYSGGGRKKSKEKRLQNEHVAYIGALHAYRPYGPYLAGALAYRHTQRVHDPEQYNEEQYQHGRNRYHFKNVLKLQYVAGRFIHRGHVYGRAFPFISGYLLIFLFIIPGIERAFEQHPFGRRQSAP